MLPVHLDASLYYPISPFICNKLCSYPGLSPLLHSNFWGRRSLFQLVSLLSPAWFSSFFSQTYPCVIIRVFKPPGEYASQRAQGGYFTRESRMNISLFFTCFNDTLFPQAGRATVELLERLGHTVDFPEEQTCCGQMHFNTGYQREALPLIRRFVQ